MMNKTKSDNGKLNLFSKLSNILHLPFRPNTHKYIYIYIHGINNTLYIYIYPL